MEYDSLRIDKNVKSDENYVKFIKFQRVAISAALPNVHYHFPNFAISGALTFPGIGFSEVFQFLDFEIAGEFKFQIFAFSGVFSFPATGIELSL